jgi:hypothetical protein
MGTPHGAPPPDPTPVVPEPVAEPEPEPVPESEPVPEPEPAAEPDVDEIDETEDDGDVPVSRASALIEEALNASLNQAELD